jgi:hypothetical protein
MVEDENERVGRVEVDVCKVLKTKEMCGSRCTRLDSCVVFVGVLRKTMNGYIAFTILYVEYPVVRKSLAGGRVSRRVTFLCTAERNQPFELSDY